LRLRTQMTFLAHPCQVLVDGIHGHLPQRGTAAVAPQAGGAGEGALHIPTLGRCRKPTGPAWLRARRQNIVSLPALMHLTRELKS
jgi:hypothetical protein